MAEVSYEILTRVRKSFHGKTLRAYVVNAQIIVRQMTEHNFKQLGIPAKGTVALFPANEHIPVKKELTPTALKTAITKRMTAVKKRFEKKLQPEKAAVTLTAGGNYKNKLTTITELSK